MSLRRPGVSISGVILVAVLSACGDAAVQRRSELLRRAAVDEQYVSQVDECEGAGLVIDLEAARYERLDQPATNPETGEAISHVERISAPIMDQNRRELALLVYAMASSGQSGVVISPTEDDDDGSKLRELTEALEAVKEQSNQSQQMDDARGLDEDAVLGLGAQATRGCYPWTCSFYSRRIWTWECLGYLSGGWAMVPASVAGYSEWSDHHDFAWFADYRGYGIACPSHNSGKKEGRRICCASLPCG